MGLRHRPGPRRRHRGLRRGDAHLSAQDHRRGLRCRAGRHLHRARQRGAALSRAAQRAGLRPAPAVARLLPGRGRRHRARPRPGDGRVRRPPPGRALQGPEGAAAGHAAVRRHDGQPRRHPALPQLQALAAIALALPETDGPICPGSPQPSTGHTSDRGQCLDRTVGNHRLRQWRRFVVAGGPRSAACRTGHRKGCADHLARANPQGICQGRRGIGHGWICGRCPSRPTAASD
ncbi:hypothetical protein D3C80_1314360 [compost metagenome]